MTETAVFAVIKDESAYIHEWVFHHLYFGFDHIYIAVNRTTDSTIEILEKIQTKYPQVKYFITDWIDMDSDHSGQNPSMQRLSYSYLTHRCRINNENITHILPIDADEFWFPIDFKTKVNDFINTAPNFDLMSFHWACQDDDDMSFSLPFANQMVLYNQHVKSLISHTLIPHIEKFTLHVPNVNLENITHLDGIFEVFKSGKNRQISNADFNRQQKAYILHRMIRSDTEYLALLQRRRPSSTLRIKDNRRGINKHNSTEKLDLGESQLYEYHKAINLFTQNSAIAGILDKTRQDIVEKSSEVLSVNDDILFEHLEIYYKVLKGTAVFNTLHSRVLNYMGDHTVDAINSIRDIAISLENIDFDKSVELMKIAQINRPNSECVKKKIIEYSLKLNKCQPVKDVKVTSESSKTQMKANIVKRFLRKTKLFTL
jgi:hypothetical protein